MLSKGRLTHHSRVADLFKRLLPPVLMIAAAACTESGGMLEPSFDDISHAVDRQIIRFEKAMVPDQFTALELTADGEVALAPVAKPQLMFEGSPGLTLSMYEVSFWAVRGKKREIRVDYLDDSKDKPKWTKYFSLKVDKKSLLARPDGTPIADGDSVLITAVVDPVYISVSLEPSGLQFDEDHPVEIEWFYKGAAEDVNGDGVVNSIDEEIFDNLYMLWQHEKGDPWHDMPFEHDRKKKKIKALLNHFSSYAVSW